MPGAKDVPRRRLPAAERRKLILAEARSAFLEAGGGATGVSARAIAQRCGIDEALIYRHFGSKDELYAEAILEPLGEVLHQLAEGAGTTEPVGAEPERLARMWRLTYDLIVNLCSLPPDVVRAIALLHYGKSKEGPLFYQRTLRPALRAFELVVEAEFPNWNHRLFSSSLAVREALSTVFWVVVEADLAGTELDREGTARAVADLLLYGMVHPSAQPWTRQGGISQHTLT